MPSLKAPGFIKAAADGAFMDASAVGASGQLVLLVKSSTPEYQVTPSGGWLKGLVSGLDTCDG